MARNCGSKLGSERINQTDEDVVSRVCMQISLRWSLRNKLSRKPMTLWVREARRAQVLPRPCRGSRMRRFNCSTQESSALSAARDKLEPERVSACCKQIIKLEEITGRFSVESKVESEEREKRENYRPWRRRDGEEKPETNSLSSEAITAARLPRY